MNADYIRDKLAARRQQKRQFFPEEESISLSHRILSTVLDTQLSR
jgi:hypothetical protein